MSEAFGGNGPNVGDRFPDITLPDQTNAFVNLHQARGEAGTRHLPSQRPVVTLLQDAAPHGFSDPGSTVCRMNVAIIKATYLPGTLRSGQTQEVVDQCDSCWAPCCWSRPSG